MLYLELFYLKKRWLTAMKKNEINDINKTIQKIERKIEDKGQKSFLAIENIWDYEKIFGFCLYSADARKKLICYRVPDRSNTQFINHTFWS